MKSIVLIILSLFSLNCTAQQQQSASVKGNQYKLNKAENQKAVLVLFPCFPCNSEYTRTEARFLKGIEKKGITTLLLDYNQKLFLTKAEKREYSEALNTILDQNKVLKENIYIGGFSSGGNVALLIANFLLETKNQIQPRGLFVVDSPIDLEKLYNDAKKDIARNVNKEAVEEGKFLTALLGEKLGNPNLDLEKYKQYSPYLISCNSVENIRYLKDIKTRFYCEPSLEWQLKNKNRRYEDLNAFMLKKVNQSLTDLGSRKTEYIETENRGVNTDGKKNPHSWNLVEQSELLEWLLQE
ncbi:hypothetical protein [Chryseobacterium sp.]|uniref:hypothetical protein n=1 Tax=Chryseobacterium sp. TaxID=1871047 RepID=UPI0025C1B097|nr:hypothetical protein [Chryseobacterium sp.]